MKKTAVLLLVCAVLSLPACRSGARSGEFELVDSLLWTKAYDIEVRGDLAFCAFLNGLMVLDLSNPREAAPLSRLYLGGGSGIALAGDNVYLAAGEKGLCVIEISDPSSPRLVARLDTPGDARDLVVSGNTAYIADGPGGLAVADVSDPASPALTATLETPGEAEALILSEAALFLAGGQGGLHIVDVSDPAAPRILATHPTSGRTEEVTVEGATAYVADGDGGLRILDMEDPSHPVLLSSFTTSGYAHGITARNGYAYVGNLYDGAFQIVDVRDPRAPRQAGWRKYTMYNEAWDVEVADGLAYVVDYFAGIYLLNIKDPSNPRPAGSFYTPGSIIAASGEGDRICALGDLSGFQVIDASVPGHLRIAASSQIFRGVHGMAAAAGLGYATDRWGLRIFDLGKNPIPQIGNLQLEGVSRALVLRGDMVYLTSDLAGLHIVSVADPASPRLLGGFPMDGFAYGLDVVDGIAYIANSDTGFHILDARDPAAVTQLGFLETPGLATGVHVREGTAYVADGDAGLVVVDVSDPALPRILGSCPVDGFANSVRAEGDYAYLTDESFGLLKVDVSDPGSPEIVARFETPGEAASVSLWGDFILVADSYSLIVVKQR